MYPLPFPHAENAESAEVCSHVWNDPQSSEGLSPYDEVAI